MIQVMDGGTLSAIFGWISTGSRIVMYAPQLIENYWLQSGEGLSMLFLLGWIIGDTCNIIRATLGGSVPTAFWLGLYHLSSDVLLLSQVHYYRWKRYRWPIGPLYDVPTRNTSTTALLSEPGCYDYDYDDSLDEFPILLFNTRANAIRNGTTPNENLTQFIIKSISYLALISMLGIGAWWVDDWAARGGNGAGRWSGEDINAAVKEVPDGVFGPGWSELEWLRELIVQILEWTSAAFYIGGTLPQIYKNLSTRCEGLSPSLFLFAAFGSFAYVLSILSNSITKDYPIRNVDSIARHGLSCFLDVVVIVQIVYYRFTEGGHTGSTLYVTIR